MCAQPALRGYADPLTGAMVEFYLANQVKFTSDQHPHYIYSPRELSKWTRAIYEGIQPLEGVTVDELVRLWLHEVRVLLPPALCVSVWVCVCVCMMACMRFVGPAAVL